MNLEPRFHPEHLQIIKRFISSKVAEAHSDGVVIGVSGGLDSAVVLKLSSMIFPKNKIIPMFLPESTTPKQDESDARLIAEECKVKLLEVTIDNVLKSFLEAYEPPKNTPLALGNLKARIRMNILFYIANSLNRLVLGTSNKSELLLGYFTKYGDGASDVAPLGDIFKTQVYMLAEHLKIPQNIISKPPTAGLVLDQTDEEDLGLDYRTIDKILFGLERDLSIAKLARELNLPEDQITNIKNRMEQNRHKRKFPKIPKIGLKTIGVDLYE